MKKNVVIDGNLSQLAAEGTAKALSKILKLQKQKSLDQEPQNAMKDIRSYLVVEDPQVMINQLDERITYKKKENSQEYERNLKEATVLKRLDIQPGKLYNQPCMTMMKAYKFLSQAFNTQNHYLIDFSDP